MTNSDWWGRAKLPGLHAIDCGVVGRGLHRIEHGI
jgi:hypothetical protein